MLRAPHLFSSSTHISDREDKTGQVASNTVLAAESQKKEANLHLNNCNATFFYNPTKNNKEACLQGSHRDNRARLFIMLHGGRTKENRCKLIQERYEEKHMRKSLLTMRSVRHWNRVSIVVVQPPYLNIFQGRLGKPWSKTMLLNADSVLRRRLDKDHLLRSLPTWTFLRIL